MKNRTKIFLFILILLLFCTLLCLFFLKRPKNSSIPANGYDSVFIPMFSVPYYSNDLFHDNIGRNTFIYDPVSNINLLSSCIDDAMSSSNNIETVYLAIDPSNFKSDELTHDNALIKQIDNYPSTRFNTIISYPSLSWWTGLSGKQYVEAIDKYIQVCNELVYHQNVSLFFVSNQKWLIANESNYENGKSLTNPQISKNIMLSTFCDAHYIMSPEALSSAMTELYDITSSERATPSQYPDCSDARFVFFGDSVMAINRSSSSSANAFKSFTKADVTVLSICGTPAAQTDSLEFNLSVLVDSFLSGTHLNNDDFNIALDEYVSKKFSPDLHHYFVIYLGLNDYFNGNAIGDINSDDSTYIGALKTNIDKLNAAFPNSEFILIAPNRISEFEYGTMEIMPGIILKDYADAVKELSVKLNCGYIDIYGNDAFSPEKCKAYLHDGVHPNEAGQFIIAEEITKYMAR